MYILRHIRIVFSVPLRNKEGDAFYVNIESISVLVIVICYLPAVFYGIDTGMSWIGFLKMLAVFFFLCLTMQLAIEQKEELLETIPLTGCIMTVVGMLSYLIKPAYQFFFTADRLGGFFQYANVFALFCLIGCILLTEQLEKSAEHIDKIRLCSQILLLITGILLSGSRSVCVLAIVSGIVIALRKRTIRVQVLAAIGITILAAFLYAYMTGNMQNIGRLFTSSLHSSTFLGRILYAKDGLRQIFLHPFGLGYLGYYFIEPAVQTGVYNVRYIHNDFLQIALDIGMVPALLFVYVLGKNLFGKGRKFEHRLIIAIMAIHCLVDFDLEFIAVWFLLILNLDLHNGKEISLASREKGVFYKILIGMTAIVELYTGAAMIPRYLGNEKISAVLLPFYTEVQKEILIQETEESQAERRAEQILKQNAYVPEAYDILAMRAYQNGDYAKMSEYKEESLKLQKYNAETYERYLLLLSGTIERANENQDSRTVKKLMKSVLYVDRQRNRVKETTDALAYEIRDVPNLTFSDEAEDYIVQVKQLLGK